MELENNPTPIETLDMPENTDSYISPPSQGQRLRNFGRFAKRYQSHKALVITLTVVALLFLSYGAWALVKNQRSNPEKVAATSDSSSIQKTVVVLPGQDQILSINAKLQVNNASTISGDLNVGGDVKAGKISATTVSGSFTGNGS